VGRSSPFPHATPRAHLTSRFMWEAPVARCLSTSRHPDFGPHGAFADKSRRVRLTFRPDDPFSCGLARACSRSPFLFHDGKTLAILLRARSASVRHCIPHPKTLFTCRDPSFSFGVGLPALIRSLCFRSGGGFGRRFDRLSRTAPSLQGS